MTQRMRVITGQYSTCLALDWISGRPFTRPTWAILCVVIFLLASPTAYAQTADMVSYYRQAYITVSQNYRTSIRPKLPPEQQQVLDQVRFLFNPTQDLVAQARILPNGQRIVEISYGWLAFTHNILFGFAVSGELGQPICFAHYLDASAERLFENARHARDNQPLTIVPFFAEYVRRGGTGCASIQPHDLLNQDAFDYANRSMNAALAVLLGHEIAHHVLGHLERPDRGDLEESRRMETEADTFALEYALAIGINPIPASPMWALLAAVGGWDIGHELESTHPLGIRRWVAAIESSLLHMQDVDYELHFGAAPTPLELDGLEEMLEHLRRFVP